MVRITDSHKGFFNNGLALRKFRSHIPIRPLVTEGRAYWLAAIAESCHLVQRPLDTTNVCSGCSGTSSSRARSGVSDQGVA